MRTNRFAAFLLAVIAAASLTAAVPAPAAADVLCSEAEPCEDPNLPPGGNVGGPGPEACQTPAQSAFVGWRQEMISCQLSLNLATMTLSAKTRLVSDSITGFHGCVRVEFYAGSSFLWHTPEYRWGVGAFSSRTELWTDMLPSTLAGWDEMRFVHRHCGS